MFEHIVLYKVKDPEKNVPEMKRLLLSLPAKIPEIKKMCFGIDELHTERSSDASLYVQFESEADYHSYKDNPEHLKVAAFIGSIKISATSCDYYS